MKKIILGLLFLTVGSTWTAAESLVGIYEPLKLGSRLELTAEGTFSLESVGEIRLWFLSGTWTKSETVLILSWGEEIARYSIEADGQKLSLIQKFKAAASIEYDDAALATEYKREPIQPPQSNAGSRPSSDDSPASETPSAPAPRG